MPLALSPSVMGTVNTTVERVVLETVDQGSAALKQAQTGWAGLRSNIDSVKGALAAVGVTLGAGAMVALYKDVLAATSALDDMSESTGSSVENLSALQRVAHVAGADFGFVTDSMGRMVKGLKGADEEGQAAAHALKFLGIEAKDANGNFRDQGEVMVEVAKSLKGLADDGNKLALVQDLYGKGAQRLLPYLKDLADETDRHVTVTAKQAAEAEEAEKAMRRLGLAYRDMARGLAMEITPWLTKMLEQMSEGIRIAGGFGAALKTFGLKMAPITPGQEGARIREYMGRLEEIEVARARGGLGLAGTQDLDDEERELRRKLEFARFLQRQTIHGGMSPADLDARDLRAHAKSPSGYASPDRKPSGLSGYERAVLEAEQAIAKARTGNSEFVSTQLDIAAGKYGQLNEKQKEHLLQLAGQRDLERDLAEQRKEHDKAREEIGKIEAEAQERRRVDYERLMEEFEGEEEQEWRRYERKLEILRQTVSDQEEFNNLAETLEAQHQERLRKISEDGERKRFNRTKEYQKLDLESSRAWLGHVSLLMYAKNREMFEIGKAASIVSAIINTHEAAVKAYNAFAGIPIVGPAMGAAAAAGAIAFGFAQVSAIKSQSFGGGGAGGGAVGTFPASPATGLPISAGPEIQSAPAAQDRRPQQIVNIHVQGRLAQGAIEELAEQWNELAKDGFPIFNVVND